MRFIKFLGVSVVALLVVVSVLSLILPSHLRVTRSVNIAASEEAIQGALDDLRTWEQWNVFIKSGNLTGKTYSSPSAGKGAYMHSDELQLTVTGAGPDSVHVFWQQAKGRSFDGGYYIFRMQPDSITVQGWYDFHFQWYPWKKLGILLYDKKLGPVIEESLTGLKDYVEKSR